MFNQYFYLLLSNPLFVDISRLELEHLLSCLSPQIKEYSKNEYIAFAGDKATHLGTLLEGSLSLVKESYSGENNLISKLKEGNIFGEALIFSDTSIYPVSILSTEYSKILYISKESLISPCKNACSFHNALIRNLLKIISSKVLILNKKVDYLTIKGMREKLSTYIMDEYKRSSSTTIALTMNRNELADYLNVSRPSMSRELGRMRDEGIIEFKGRNIKILNLNRLK